MSVTSVLPPIVRANIEAIDQGLALVASLTPVTYQHKPASITTSSIGEHFRHILDMYFALMQGVEGKCVDFNCRRRGATVEHDLATAIDELNRVRCWLQRLNTDDDMALDVISEVTLDATASVQLNSSLSRELVFTSSHAVHHYALMGIIAKMQEVKVDCAFGVAAATATYQRQFERDTNASC